MVCCGSNGNNKNDEDNACSKPADEQVVSSPLKGTFGDMEKGEVGAEDYLYVDVAFTVVRNIDQSVSDDEASFKMNYFSAKKHSILPKSYKGPYTYSGTASEGNGSIDLYDYQHGGEKVCDAPFSIKGNKLTITVFDDTYVLNKD